MAVTPESFDAHLDVLSHDAYLVQLSGLVEFSGTTELPRAVAHTFDDGYADSVEAAAPIVDRYGAPATLFLVAGRAADAVFWWDELERIFLQPGMLPRVLEWEYDGVLTVQMTPSTPSRMPTVFAVGGPSGTSRRRRLRIE